MKAIVIIAALLLTAPVYNRCLAAKDSIMVKDEFIRIITQYSDAGTASRLWNEVDTSYSGSRRFYHTLVHLDNFYYQLRQCKQLIADWDVLMVAMVYHDVVYGSPDHKDEERSAELAVQRLRESHFPEAGIKKCEALILATKTHAQTNDVDMDLFNDADMTILGLDRATYAGYVKNVGLEYGVTPQFLQGRKRVLQYFLKMDRIFKTDFFYKMYEKQARENIAWEISTLP